MQTARFTASPSVSPHKLFQSLWKAVEANDNGRVQQLVDALVTTLSGNQTLAPSAVMELIDAASRDGRDTEIKKALTRLPGFAAGLQETKVRHSSQ